MAVAGVSLIPLWRFHPRGVEKSRATIESVRRLAPTAILFPGEGTRFVKGDPIDIEGTSEPGAIVRLVYAGQVIGQELSSLDGRFRFRILGLGVGFHEFRAVAIADGRGIWSDPRKVVAEEPVRRVRTKGAKRQKAD